MKVNTGPHVQYLNKSDSIEEIDHPAQKRRDITFPASQFLFILIKYAIIYSVMLVSESMLLVFQQEKNVQDMTGSRSTRIFSQIFANLMILANFINTKIHYLSNYILRFSILGQTLNITVFCSKVFSVVTDILTINSMTERI